MEELGSKWLVLPADTSGTCTRLGGQEDGVVLCDGRSGDVLVWVVFLAQSSGNAHGGKKNPGARRSVSRCLL